eukprot:EG_transcript_21159
MWELNERERKQTPQSKKTEVNERGPGGKPRKSRPLISSLSHALDGRRSPPRPASEQEQRLRSIEYLRSKERVINLRKQRLAMLHAQQPVSGPRSPNMPLTHAELRKFQAVYDSLEEQASNMGWLQLLEIGNQLGLKATPVQYARLERERPVSLTLLECVQFYFPGVQARDLNRMQSAWNSMSMRRESDPKLEGDWWTRYDPKVLEELISIFTLWTRDRRNDDSAPLLRRQALTEMLPPGTITDVAVASLFDVYGVEGGAALTLESFVEALSGCYVVEDYSHQPKVKLYFQAEDDKGR